VRSPGNIHARHEANEQARRGQNPYSRRESFDMKHNEKDIPMDWFGFWIFLAVLVVCDHWIFAQGYDSFFQSHKTVEEKELQRLKIEELRRRVGEDGARADVIDMGRVHGADK
jgi:hypothetical protein